MLLLPVDTYQYYLGTYVSIRVVFHLLEVRRISPVPVQYLSLVSTAPSSLSRDGSAGMSALASKLIVRRRLPMLSIINIAERFRIIFKFTTLNYHDHKPTIRARLVENNKTQLIHEYIGAARSNYNPNRHLLSIFMYDLCPGSTPPRLMACLRSPNLYINQYWLVFLIAALYAVPGYDWPFCNDTRLY